MPALHLLDRSRRGERVDLGRKAVVVGGGDTAMDAVRTAQRFTGEPVTLLYRRTRHEMPAAEEELEGALEEGNILEELVVAGRGRCATAAGSSASRCVRNRSASPARTAAARRSRSPAASSSSPCDTVIVAVGQLPELAFLDGSRVARHKGGGVLVDGTTRCAGPGGRLRRRRRGRSSRAASSRRARTAGAAAEAICEHLGVPFAPPPWSRRSLSEQDILEVKEVRARRVAAGEAGDAAGRRAPRLLADRVHVHRRRRRAPRRCAACSARRSATSASRCARTGPTTRSGSSRSAGSCRSLACDDDGTLGGRRGGRSRSCSTRQILHVDDFCNECDDCQTFCVHQGKPYTRQAAAVPRPGRLRGRTGQRVPHRGRHDLPARGRARVAPHALGRSTGLRGRRSAGETLERLAGDRGLGDRRHASHVVSAVGRRDGGPAGGGQRRRCRSC